MRTPRALDYAHRETNAILHVRRIDFRSMREERVDGIVETVVQHRASAHRELINDEMFTLSIMTADN